MKRAAFWLILSVCWLAAAQSEAASLSGIVTVGGIPVDGAVVYLESTSDHPQGPLNSSPVVVEQRNLAFSPAVIPIVRGTTVTFANQDSVPHGVYSPSAEAGKFNLKTYGRGEERRIVFASPGEIIVLCNIHPEMEAHLLVLKDPYFAVTTAGGQYQVRDVPLGTYFLRVWRARSSTSADPVELSLAGDLTLDLRLNP